MRVLNLLKQSSATASASATEDQASDHVAHNKVQRSEWDLEVTEAPPTSDQLRSILEYLGGAGAVGRIIKGASGESDALSKLKESADAFQRPLVRSSMVEQYRNGHLG